MSIFTCLFEHDVDLSQNLSKKIEVMVAKLWDNHEIIMFYYFARRLKQTRYK